MIKLPFRGSTGAGAALRPLKPSKVVALRPLKPGRDWDERIRACVSTSLDELCWAAFYPHSFYVTRDQLGVAISVKEQAQ